VVLLGKIWTEGYKYGVGVFKFLFEDSKIKIVI